MDRFNLEEFISRSWTVSDDIDALITRIKTTDMPKWKVLDTLNGMKNMHDLRTHQLYDCYEQLLEEGVITSERFVKVTNPT